MTTTTTKHQNYIAGKWRDAEGGATFEDRNPSRTND